MDGEPRRGSSSARAAGARRASVCLLLCLVQWACSDKSNDACCCRYCKADEVACNDSCISKNQDCPWPRNSGCACEQDQIGRRQPCAADWGTGDLLPCKRPPISQCWPPGEGNPVSPKHYYCRCLGSCAGGATPVQACSTQLGPQYGDCRIFATSCIPESYTMCTPENVLNDQQLGGLCKYCFFAEAGIPAACEKLVDSGTVDLGSKRQ